MPIPHPSRRAIVAVLALLGATAASPPAPTPRYIYYLHGRIVEDLGPRGVSPKYGAYDYPGILAALRANGAQVVSEVRAKDTDPATYADRVVADIAGKLAAGVRPDRITVIGASKGAIIAALVSTKAKRKGLRYVLIAGCNASLIRTYHPRLTGDVLSIYEASDDIGETCRPLMVRSPGIGRFSEVRLSTGLGHGVLYTPAAAWVGPALRWAGR